MYNGTVSVNNNRNSPFIKIIFANSSAAQVRGVQAASLAQTTVSQFSLWIRSYRFYEAVEAGEEGETPENGSLYPLV